MSHSNSAISRLNGRCWALFAFDVGDWVLLNRCTQILGGSSLQAKPGTRRGPSDFGLDPLPVLHEMPPVELQVKGALLKLAPRALVYDFGVISIGFSFQHNEPMPAWREFFGDLYDDPALLELAKQHVEKVIEKFRPAIDDQRLAKLVESYFVLQIDEAPGGHVADWVHQHRHTLAQILRGETLDLSDEEIQDSLLRQIAYGHDDLVILDWNAAFIIDSEYEDTLAVLDFANAKLLELRILDHRLDDLLEDSYRMIRASAAERLRQFFPAYSRPIRRLTELMADAASEFEAANNAIKLTNDQYLARVFRLASKRLHLLAFEADIQRKLETLREIHSVYNDRAATRRIEFLEWIVIILIAFEIVKGFF